LKSTREHATNNAQTYFAASRRREGRARKVAGFVGRHLVFFSVLLALLCGSARANVCVYPTIHVLSVQGQVSDPLGEAIPQVRVIAKRGQQTVAESTANQQGNFHLRVPRGEYDIHFEAPGFAPGYAHIKVGFGVRSAFHSSFIKIVLSPGVVCRNESGIRFRPGAQS